MLLNKLKLPAGGNETTISPANISFVGGARDFIDSITPNAWFGPNQPLKPQAPMGTLPRGFDYQFGANLIQQPRTEEIGAIPFGNLRAFSNKCDIVRTIIQHRKQQIQKVPFVFKKKAPKGTSLLSRGDQNKPKADEDPRIQVLTDFFERPDRQHSFVTWLDMILEEVFVTDALSIWPMYDKSGALMALNIIDGATIKPLHDEQGWTPSPPNPAYQQYIKGMPSVNMSSGFCDRCQVFRKAGITPLKHIDGSNPCNPMVYQVRTPRVNKFYGFPNVEWILRTVILAINRQMSQIYYFTEGNVPEMIVQAPEEWNKTDIAAFQAMFDASAGDLQKRRRVWFVPATKGITQTKDAILKGELDEWIARVCCFAFGVNPQPFVRMMNRATAQVAADSAASEGTLPELIYLASLFNYIIRYFFFIEDIEFVWKSDEETDGQKEMRILSGYVKAGILGVDEVRQDLGFEPVGIGNIIVTNSGVLPLTPETLQASVEAINQGAEDGDTGTGTKPDNEPKNGTQGKSKVP